MSPQSATLRYLRSGTGRPVYHASQGGADAALNIGAEFDEHVVEIHDARQLDPPASLDAQGFCLVEHATGVDDFYQLESIRGTVFNSPLALCDASSARSEDFVASERRAKDRIGELELVTYNPAHRWYYFPEQRFGEALLIKTFDSATDGRARRVAQTAFDNPDAPRDAPPRESIESRLLVFF